jgi:N-methylhydantoinase A
MALTIALDIGGTFTDLVAFDGERGTIWHAKASTTPADLSEGVGACLAKAGVPLVSASDFIHGSTIAINAAIERRGARTGLVVTRGMRDVYKIGRGNRPESYNIFFRRPEPYVPRELTFEIEERLGPDGRPRVPYDASSASRVADALARAGVDAVAVCLLHSYANPEHEIRVGEALAERLPGRYVSLSHRILREFREYERMSTTVLNAYVGPRVSAYLEGMERLLAERGFEGRLLIMQSNGGVMSPQTARQSPVSMMESGPVGGIIAAAEVGRALGSPDVIAFDMGGTTAKASLVQDGVPEIAHGYYIGGYASGHPVMLPVVDVVEVGAGGGSIARVDEIGALKVGPESAGGWPGPICYGWGGAQPTVTDANVVLGRISAGRFLGGEMPLDLDAARRGIERVGRPLGMDALEAAGGIVDIAIAKMALAVRAVSVERGFDPRDYALLAFGGAGPLHACAIARELHIPRVIVPVLPAHFSAVGMLAADLRHDYVRTCYTPLAQASGPALASIAEALIAEGRTRLAAEGIADGAMGFEVFLDVRYIGQEFTLQTPVTAADLAADDRRGVRAAFDRLHERRYRHHSPDEPVEVVNVRAVATGSRPKPRPTAAPRGGGDALVETRAVLLRAEEGPTPCPIYDRAGLAPGEEVVGPAVIEEYASNTLVPSGARAVRIETGELMIEVGAP